MNFGEIKIHSRHLPHWEANGAIYFITFRTHFFSELTIDEQVIVKDHIVDGNSKFYTLIAVVVMLDHVHVLLFPNPSNTLSRIMKGIKGVSARKINNRRKTEGTIWQDESFDRVVRDEVELKEKFYYMVNNPLKRSLTENVWSYHVWWSNSEIVIR